jgi:hypothetical protein
VNVQPQTVFRRAILLLATLLGLQCVWLLLPELSRANVDRLPTDAASAATAAKERNAAALAASIAGIRGDLWAQSAFTYADLLWSDANTNADLARSLQGARGSLVRALADAPHQSGAWLLASALASRYPSFNFNAAEALKMSYYTGPSEPDLMPLRLRIAMNSGVFTDSEIREFVARDLRLFLERNDKSAIIDAYNATSAAGKKFIEQTVGDIDPSALELFRTGAQK